jgi:hypothetical protein
MSCQRSEGPMYQRSGLDELKRQLHPQSLARYYVIGPSVAEGLPGLQRRPTSLCILTLLSHQLYISKSSATNNGRAKMSGDTSTAGDAHTAAVRAWSNPVIRARICELAPGSTLTALARLNREGVRHGDASHLGTYLSRVFPASKPS